MCNPLSVQFNHLLIFANDKYESASFLTSILGLPEPIPAGFFLAVEMENNVILHFGEPKIPILSQHYAFLVSDAVFDASLERLKARNIPFWADPRQQRLGEINDENNGRGFYFFDPSGHGLELITHPYIWE
ncbi:MAG: VOC family protein [Chloroflexi bacterium]|nr:VOC family protein [Chloroflexota bacterium]